jgi:hypothetical protein
MATSSPMTATKRLVRHRKPAPLEIEEQFPPGLGALVHAIGEADERFLEVAGGTPLR